jgi:acyl-CoA thioesterase
MLFELDGPAAFGGRAVGRGPLYDARGHLVASCTQEATLRHLAGLKFSAGASSLQID